MAEWSQVNPLTTHNGRSRGMVGEAGRGSQPLYLFKPVGYLYHMSDTKNCCNGHESEGNDHQLKTFLSYQRLRKYVDKGMENICTYVKG